MPDGTANPTRINAQAASARKRRRPLGVMALEPRVMYDAAAVTTTATIWATTTHTAGNTTAAATAVEKIAVDGTSAATAPVDVTDGATSGGELTQLAGIAVDTARQKFFVVDKDTSGNFVILSGSTVTGALDATPVYTLAAAGRGANISGLQINAQTGELYFTQSVPASSTGTSQTGIFMVSEFATNLTQADIATNVAPGDTTHVGQVVSLAAADTPKNLALDFQDNLVFFTESSGQGGLNDKIGIASLSPDGQGNVTFFQATSLPGVTVNTNNGQLSGIAVDPARGMLYFTTDDLSHQDQNYVFSAHFTVSGSGDTATATLDTSTINHLTLGSSGAPTAIVLDVPDGLFYVTNLTASPDAFPTRPSGNIQVGSLDQAGNVVSSQTLTTVFDASTLQVGLTNPVNLFIETTPTVTAGDTAIFTQNGPAVSADAGLAAVDSSGQDFAGATVAISGGALDGDTLTASTSGTNIAWTYDSASHTLRLSGVDTAANYQRVLETITFSSTSADPTNGGTDAQRTLSWTVTDGLLTSNTATSIVEIHRAPIVTAGDTATFFGGGAPVTLDGTLTVTDPDGSGTLSSATVQIGSGFITGDTLAAVTTGTNINASYDANAGVLTLTGQDTLAHYQSVLDSVTYSFNPGNGDPTAGGGDTSRTITWTVNNGAAPSNAVTSTLDAVHVAPNVAASGTTATFIAGGAPVTVDSGLAVGDVDSNNTLIGTTVTITGGFLAGDTLDVNTSGTNITASYDAATGTLTLSGNDTPAHYQQVLDTVAFGSSSADPTNNGTDTQRTLTWTVDDGVMRSSAATSLTVHTPPSITAGGAPTFIAGGSPVTLDGSLTVSDVDSTSLTTATVTISSGFLQGDTLAANTSGTNIAASYDAATGTLTLSGNDTMAHYQQVLDTVVYSSTQADPTSGGTNTQRTLTWSVSDALSSAAAASTVTVHTPPSLGGGGATATFIGGGPAVTLDAGLTVSDVDSTTLTTATVTIGSGFLPGDTLAANTSGTNITASYDSTTHTLTLSGTASVQDYQKVLESVTYSFPGTGDPTQGGNTTRTISWAVNDGVAWSNSATTTLSTVNAVHAPPSVAGAGNITPYSKQGPAAVVDGALTLSDPDSGGMLTGATVTISSGFLSGDTLAAVTTGTGITASYNANTGVLTLTGQDTIAHYQSVLDSVTYSSTNNNPSQGNKDTTRTITWVVNDGATSNNLSAPVTSMIDLTPGQSVVHAPHGKNAAPVLASSAVAPTPGGSAPLVTNVDPLQSADGDEHDAVPAWTAAHSRGERDDHAALDLRHAVVATDAELLAARRGQAGDEGRHLGDGDKRAHGKPSLLAQLKAAGRHGFAHERQALIKDLPKRSAVR